MIDPSWLPIPGDASPRNTEDLEPEPDTKNPTDDLLGLTLYPSSIEAHAYPVYYILRRMIHMKIKGVSAL